MKARSWIVLSSLLLVAVALVAVPQPAAAAGGAGATCGGIAGLKCDPGFACKYPVNKCNVADLAGKCVKVPDTCPKQGPPVCGCDDKTYDNQCELLKAGVREAHRGACKAAAPAKPGSSGSSKPRR